MVLGLLGPGTAIGSGARRAECGVAVAEEGGLVVGVAAVLEVFAAQRGATGTFGKNAAEDQVILGYVVEVTTSGDGLLITDDTPVLDGVLSLEWLGGASTVVAEVGTVG